MADTPEREEIARRYGFASYAELLDASESLPTMPGDTHKSYIARHPQQRWFVWKDTSQPIIPKSDS